VAGLVLDASVLIAALLPDDADADASNRLLTLLDEVGALVPALWPTELANGLLVATRRRRIPETRIAEALAEVATLPIEIEPPDPAMLWSMPLALALRHGLTLHDATYLDLARRLELPLASFDRALRAAATAEGVTVLP
jgi:predicted nucleic acid-binding protein